MLAIILIKVIILILLQFRAKQQTTIVYPDFCVVLQEGAIYVILTPYPLQSYSSSPRKFNPIPIQTYILFYPSSDLVSTLCQEVPLLVTYVSYTINSSTNGATSLLNMFITNPCRKFPGIVVFVNKSAKLNSPFIQPTLIVPAACASRTR